MQIFFELTWSLIAQLGQSRPLPKWESSPECCLSCCTSRSTTNHFRGGVNCTLSCPTWFLFNKTVIPLISDVRMYNECMLLLASLVLWCNSTFLQARWSLVRAGSAGWHKLMEHGNRAARKWRDREEMWRASGRGEKKSERRECFGGNL